MSNLMMYVATMTVVTYLIRVLPLTLFNKPITNIYVRSFLYYIPYVCKLQKEYGFTIVMVTHNLNIAEMANTVIKMNSGKISEIYTNEAQKTAYEIGW